MCDSRKAAHQEAHEPDVTLEGSQPAEQHRAQAYCNGSQRRRRRPEGHSKEKKDPELEDDHLASQDPIRTEAGMEERVPYRFEKWRVVLVEHARFDLADHDQ